MFINQTFSFNTIRLKDKSILHFEDSSQKKRFFSGFAKEERENHREIFPLRSCCKKPLDRNFEQRKLASTIMFCHFIQQFIFQPISSIPFKLEVVLFYSQNSHIIYTKRLTSLTLTRSYFKMMKKFVQAHKT
jgi:hypothetical protein